MYGDLQKWMPVKDVLNFRDEGESIFTRPKPLSEKTLERIYAGLVKYIAKGDTAFISKYFSGRPAGKVNSINDPASTITAFGGQTLVQPEFIVQRNNGNPNSKLVDIDGPALRGEVYMCEGAAAKLVVVICFPGDDAGRIFWGLGFCTCLGCCCVALLCVLNGLRLWREC